MFGAQQKATLGPQTHIQRCILAVELLQEDVGREESARSTQAATHLTQKRFLKE